MTKLQKDLEAREKAPICLSNGRYNYANYRLPDGTVIYHGRYSPPPADYLAAEAACEAADKQWVLALEAATDPKTAAFIEYGPLTRSTTRRLLLEAALAGYRPKLIESRPGKWDCKRKAYYYEDTIQVPLSEDGDEPTRGEVRSLFGCSGNRNTWTVLPNGLIQVTNWSW